MLITDLKIIFFSFFFSFKIEVIETEEWTVLYCEGMP